MHRLSERFLFRLEMLVALLAGATLAGFAGGAWWPFDLLSSFRSHYAAALLLVSIALVIAGRWRTAAVALAGLAVNLAVLAAPFGVIEASARPMAAAGPQKLRLVTLNVWFRNHDYERVARYLASTDADVIVLQEVTDGQVRAITAQLPGYPHVFAGAARAVHGAAVVSRYPIIASQAVQLVPDGVVVADVDLEIDGQPVSVIGAHLHWPVGPRASALHTPELAALARLAQSSDGPTLVTGDLNITQWSPWFARFLRTSRLEDCAGGATFPGSWPAWFGLASIRIDHCLRSAHFESVAVRRGPLVGSDHSPVVTDLTFAPRVASR